MDSKDAASLVGEILRSESYQNACSRKNCALAALWFAAKFCDDHDPQSAQIIPTGGIIIYNLDRFSFYYQILTNTEKVKPSKSSFDYAARQNLENHFIYMNIPGMKRMMFFYNPYFLKSYNSTDGNITVEIINQMLRPWSRQLTRARKEEYQQLFHSYYHVVKTMHQSIPGSADISSSS